MNWLTNCPVYLFAVLLCTAHAKSPIYSQQVVLKIRWPTLAWHVVNIVKKKNDKLNFDCSETIWKWKWVVCIRISTDVLLLLFAQRCSPLVTRKSGDFWLHVDYDTSISQKVLLISVLLICSYLKAYVFHSFKVCFQKVLIINCITKSASDLIKEEWFMFVLITHLGFHICKWVTQSVCILTSA